MNRVIMAVAVSMAISHCAAEASVPLINPSNDLTAEQRINKQKRFMQKSGGLLQVPGIGKIIVVNCQKTLPESAFTNEVSKFANMTHANFERTTMDKFDFATPARLMPELDAQAAIFIIDDASLPMCLLSPEGNWSVVNVSQIAASTADPAKVEDRFRREFLRAGSLALGAWSSRTEKSTLQAARNPGELDSLPVDYLTVNEFQSIMNYLPSIGIKPSSLTTYKQACREGWAPAPTNECQKAIWEKVKADKERGPTNPIEIRPPNSAK